MKVLAVLFLVTAFFGAGVILHCAEYSLAMKCIIALPAGIAIGWVGHSIYYHH